MTCDAVLAQTIDLLQREERVSYRALTFAQTRGGGLLLYSEMLAKARALIHRNVGFPCWEPELHRTKGEFLRSQSSDNPIEAESCFQQALTIAQNQSAKSWELRAATGLAQLWQSQDKRDEAPQVRGEVYGWFTESFDTADLQDAKALLDELASTAKR